MNAEPLLELLQPHLPPIAFHILLNLVSSATDTINTLVWALTNPTDPGAADALKSLIPSLLSFLALYFTIMSVYRTIRSAFRLVFFLVKWVGIIAALGMGLAYLMNGAPNRGDFSDLTARFNEFESTVKGYASRPAGAKTGSKSIWDKFDARDREGGGQFWWQNGNKDKSGSSNSAFEFVMEQIGSYKWVVDSLAGSNDDGKDGAGRAKAKSRSTPKSKAGQRVR